MGLEPAKKVRLATSEPLGSTIPMPMLVLQGYTPLPGLSTEVPEVDPDPHGHFAN